MTSLVRGEPRRLGSLPAVGPLGYGLWRFTTDDVAFAQRLIEAALEMSVGPLPFQGADEICRQKSRLRQIDVSDRSAVSTATAFATKV